jgi:cytochrome P450
MSGLFDVGKRVFAGGLWGLRQFDRWRAGNPPMRSSAAYQFDPYPSFTQMRTRGNILRSYANQGWLVLGYDEVQALLLDKRFSTDARNNRFFYNLARIACAGLPVPMVDKPGLLNLDPPQHTPVRKLVTQGLVKKFITAQTEFISELADVLLDQAEAEPGTSFDFVSKLAQPLPALVIAKMMGVEEQHRGKFQQWSEAIMGAMMVDQPELMRDAAQAAEDMRTYMRPLLNRPAQAGQANLIELLLQAEAHNHALSREEVLSNCILLLTAGHETTTRLLANGLLTLLRHPEQLELLRQRPELMDGFIEEVLRFEPPIQVTLRFVTEDLIFFGKKFKRNQVVLVYIAAANRDPTKIENPEVFDILREPVRHVSFGHGIHHCLGMSLARLEAKIVFEKMLQRYSNLKLGQDGEIWGMNPFFRGPNRLPLEARP